jgi:hypothetical protein
MRDLAFDIVGRYRGNAAFAAAEADARRFNGVLDQSQRLLGLLSTGARAIGIGLAIGGAEQFASSLREAVKQAADLVDLSRKVALPTEDLQRLLFGFEQAGIDASTTETALVQWSKRIAEAYTQGGKLAEIFRANGVSLTDSNGKLRSSLELMAAYADLVKNAGSDQERILLAIEGFGRGGADMVLVLQNGAAGLRAINQEADAAGTVMGDKVLQRAAEIDDKFNAVARTVETEFKTQLILAADTLMNMVGMAEKLGNALAKPIELVPGAVPYDYDQIRRLIDQKQEVERALRLNEGLAADDAAKGLGADPDLAAEIAQQRARIAELERRIATIAGQPAADRGDGVSEMARRQGWATGREKTTVIPNGDADAAGRGGIDPWANLREVDKERNAVYGLIAAMEEEYRLLGMTAEERRAAEVSRRAGAAATDDERAAIIRLNEATHRRREEMRLERDAIRENRQEFRSFVGTILDGVTAGEKFGLVILKALANLGANWGDRAMERVAEWLFPDPSGGSSGGGGRGIVRALFGNASKVAAAPDAATVGAIVRQAAASSATMESNYARGAVTRGPLPAIGAHGNAAADALFEYLASGKPASHITGMAADLQSGLARMIADAPGNITINSGARSIERQAELWKAAVARYGSEAAARRWVAPPGRSQHNFGNAADLGFADAATRSWAHENAERYGLRFPLGNEPWHVETANARTGGVNAALDEMTTKMKNASGAIDTMATKSIDAGDHLAKGIGKLGTVLQQAQGAGGLGSIARLFMGGIGSGSFWGSGAGGAGVASWGGSRIGGFARGGRISGPGSGTSDDVLTWTSNGEYIVNTRSTDKYLALLEAINADRLPAFADGGQIKGSGRMSTEPYYIGRDMPPMQFSGRLGSAGGGAGVPSLPARPALLDAAQSGGASSGQVTIEQHFMVSGAISSQDVIAMVHEGAQQGAAAAVARVKAELPGYQAQLQKFGRIS